MRRLLPLALLALLRAHADEGFEALLRSVRPSEGELAFQDVPWRPSLRKAVGEAQRDRKPVLLWAMNGHPLGCT